METVAVSQAPIVSEASAAVAPPVVGGTVAAFPLAVQDLVRFFLSLAGSSSQGAVVGAAGATVPASGVEVPLCPSAPGGGTAASCAATSAPSLAARPSSSSAAVPGSSGRQQREEELSRQGGHRRRSSSGETVRANKRRPRERSPSPVCSSRRREASYRSSSGSFEEGRVESPPPSSGLVPGGTPGVSRPAPADDHSPHSGPSGWRRRSSAAADQSHSGFGSHLSPPPPLLRVRRTMTALVPSIPWTLTGMILSGLSWPSSGTSIAWKSWQASPRLDARLLLRRSVG